MKSTCMLISDKVVSDVMTALKSWALSFGWILMHKECLEGLRFNNLLLGESTQRENSDSGLSL